MDGWRRGGRCIGIVIRLRHEIAILAECDSSKKKASHGLDGCAQSRKLRPMFVAFFHELKAAGVPVTLREYLTLMEAMEKDLAGRKVEDFYYLSRATLVKDERNLDKFDR